MDRVSLPEVDDVMTLWVDAICINQKNTPERNSQVRQMGTIYRRAKEVQVWLGEDNDIDSRLFDNLLEAGTFARLCGTTSRERDRISQLYQRLGFEGQLPGGEISNMTDRMRRIFQDLGRLLRLPWFQRVWVVQEVVLPKSINISLHCGQQCMPWNIFNEVMKAVMLAIKTGLLGISADGLALASAIRHDMPGTESEQGPINLPGQVMMTFIDDVVLQRNRKDPLSLLNLVGDSRGLLQATDARDHIYGFLGIAPNPDLISPDYSKTAGEIYAQFAKSTIEETGTLDILGDCRLYDNRKFPSWVPDWTQAGPRNLPMESALRNRITLYRADFGLDKTISFENNLIILKVKGVFWDKVLTIGEQAKIPHQDCLAVMQQWLELLAENSQCRSPYSSRSGAILEAFWRCMCTDDEGNSSTRAPERFGDEFYTAMYSKLPESLRADVPPWREQLNTTLATPQNLLTLLMAISAKANGRRFMISSDNYIGLAPNEAQVGDEIFVLAGSSVPFILRPEDGHHLVIGEAYVHGLMDGEASRRVDDRRAEIRDISLH